LATQFQNRLIGTVILVSLGVIFLPDLLMGKKNDISAPAGSIPLRPEQSLAGVTPENPGIAATSAAVANDPTLSVANNGSAVVVANSTATPTTGVSAAPAVVANNNENWQVEEVAAPVTITENGAVSGKETIVDNSEALKSAEIAQNKARELELKKKELLAAAKAKEAALEARRKAEQATLMQSVPVETITEKPVAEPQMTVKRDEDGLIIKTPAQVEAERAALKSGASVSTNSSYKPASQPTTVATNGGSWIIQVGVFSNAENAKALAAKLRSAGYGASAQRSGQLTRVVVGPNVSKDKLQSMLSGINRVAGTSARVIAYSAISN
jgi:DedD protein